MASQLAGLLVFSALLVGSSDSLAAIEINEFSSDSIRTRYEDLTGELRCPKCQNQNLAGSDSAVSVDLRREVLTMLESGSTDAEIKSFMRDRYGDFILYQPPVEGKTLLVWVLPVFFLLFAAAVAFFVIRNATRNARLEPGDDYIAAGSNSDTWMQPRDEQGDR